MTTWHDTKLAISDEDADQLFREAHTAYRFTDEPVSDDRLRAIYDLMRLGPTATNSTPLRIAYVRGASKERLIPLLNEGNRPKSESAPVVAILAYDLNFHEHLPVLAPHLPNAPKHFAEDEARREAFAKTSAALQAGYFILAARAAGLDAGPMGGIDAAGIDAEFFADRAWRTFMVVNLGHATEDGTRPRQPRLDYDQAVIHP